MAGSKISQPLINSFDAHSFGFGKGYERRQPNTGNVDPIEFAEFVLVSFLEIDAIPVGGLISAEQLKAHRESIQKVVATLHAFVQTQDGQSKLKSMRELRGELNG